MNLTLLLWIWVAFKGWMWVDAFQRGASTFWLVAIPIVPFAEVAYYFAVRSPGGGPWRRLFDRPVPTAEIRYRYRENPCLENEVWLAGRLLDEGEFGEAAELYASALRRDEGYLRARYGLGLCQAKRGDFEAAAVTFAHVVESDRSYADHGAWLRWAESLALSGQPERATEVLEGLVRAAPRLEHTLAWARALKDAGRGDEARRAIEQALDDYEHAPRHVKRLDREPARDANKLLGELA
ncbi:MAG: tetratricopeptide repeat protein [Proteobacteria bacterium]|nr:tetratricopeptide repeat protein [Pseudomonadota bacterium]